LAEVTAGIDLALALVEENVGHTMALAVARWLSSSSALGDRDSSALCFPAKRG
jgi:transcriptional regulator GlxA family with amidase domain